MDKMRESVERGEMKDGTTDPFARVTRSQASEHIEIPDVNSVYVSQFDVTNEVLGFFYAAGDWREKWM